MIAFSDNKTDQWFVVNKDVKKEQEGSYSTYAKCVDVICGDPGEVAFFNTSATHDEISWTCEPIGKSSPRCSSAHSAQPRMLSATPPATTPPDVAAGSAMKLL